MKYIVCIMCVIAPVLASAAFETVVQPSYQEGVFLAGESNTSFGVNSGLVNSAQTATSVAATTTNETEMQITTEIGTTTISTGTGEAAVQPQDPDLNQFVEELNAQYEVAEATCTTGSWLANIWCKIKWW